MNALTKRFTVLLLALCLAALPIRALRGDATDKYTTAIISASSAATDTSGAIRVFGPHRFNIMVCGTGFSGTYAVSQGPKSNKLGTTLAAVTMTTDSTCNQYTSFDPSTYVQVDTTRSAGSVTVYLEYFP